MKGAELELVSGEGRLDLKASARWVGPDLLVCIQGGEKPHLGAVAMAQPRPSLADPARTSATASVFTFPGHKEDLMARQAALELAAALETRVVVTAGAHWPGLTPEEIEQVVRNASHLVGQLVQALTGGRGVAS